MHRFPASTAQRVGLSKPKSSSSAEVYGFALWSSTFVVLLLWLAWAFLPDEVLHRIGVTYHPIKYWALAFPAYLVVLLIFVIFAYTAYNLANTSPLDSLATITDNYFPSNNRRSTDMGPKMKDQVCDACVLTL